MTPEGSLKGCVFIHIALYILSLFFFLLKSIYADVQFSRVHEYKWDNSKKSGNLTKSSKFLITSFNLLIFKLLPSNQNWVFINCILSGAIAMN